MEHKLISIVEKYPECMTNRTMFVGLVRDYYPTERALANIIINLFDLDMKKGIDEIDVVDDLFISRYVKKLVSNYGINAELGISAVQEWCLAYGNKYEEDCEIEYIPKAVNVSELINLDNVDEAEIEINDCDNFSEVSLKEKIDEVIAQLDMYSEQLKIDSVEAYLKIDNPIMCKKLFINADVENLKLQQFINLESLSIGSKCSIHTPDIRGLKNLKTLSLHGDRTWEEITSIDLSNIEELSITVLPDEWYVGFAAPKLKKLSIFYTETEESIGDKGGIDFSLIPQLEKLYIRHGELTDYSGLSQLQNLTELLIDDKFLTDVSFVSNMKQLKKLVIFGNVNNIKPICELQSLEYLDMSRNLISDISGLAKLSELKHLDMYGNPVVVDFDRSKIEWSCVSDEEKSIKDIEHSVDYDVEQSVRIIRNREKVDLQDVPEWRRKSEERNRKMPFIERVKQQHQIYFESGFSGLNQLRSIGRVALDEVFVREYYIQYALKKYPYLVVTQEMKKMLTIEKKKLIMEYSGNDSLVCILKGDIYIIKVSIGNGKGEINLQSNLYAYTSNKIIKKIRDYWSDYIELKIDNYMINISIQSIYKTSNSNLEECIALFALIPIKCVIDDIDLGCNKVLIGEVKKTGEFKRNKPLERELKVALNKGAENVICYGLKKTYDDPEYRKYKLKFKPCKCISDLFSSVNKEDSYQMSLFDLL